MLEAAPEVRRLLHHVLDQLADVLGHGLDHVEDVLEHVADQVGHGHPQPPGGVLQGFVQLVRDSRVQHPLLPLAAAPLSIVRRVHVLHCITMYHAVQRKVRTWQDFSMRAVVMRDKKLVVDTFPDPEPAAGEVLVKTLACGICGSDLHALKHAERMVAELEGGRRAVRDGPRRATS